jgi:hypothetical protein
MRSGHFDRLVPFVVAPSTESFTDSISLADKTPKRHYLIKQVVSQMKLENRGGTPLRGIIASVELLLPMKRRTRPSGRVRLEISIAVTGSRRMSIPSTNLPVEAYSAFLIRLLRILRLTINDATPPSIRTADTGSGTCSIPTVAVLRNVA